MYESTPCLRPPAGTPKFALMELHRQKMLGKHFRNREFGTYQSYYPRPAAKRATKKGKN